MCRLSSIEDCLLGPTGSAHRVLTQPPQGKATEAEEIAEMAEVVTGVTVEGAAVVVDRLKDQTKARTKDKARTNASQLPSSPVPPVRHRLHRGPAECFGRPAAVTVPSNALSSMSKARVHLQAQSPLLRRQAQPPPERLMTRQIFSRSKASQSMLALVASSGTRLRQSKHITTCGPSLGITTTSRTRDGCKGS